MSVSGMKIITRRRMVEAIHAAPRRPAFALQHPLHELRDNGRGDVVHMELGDEIRLLMRDLRGALGPAHARRLCARRRARHRPDGARDGVHGLQSGWVRPSGSGVDAAARSGAAGGSCHGAGHERVRGRGRGGGGLSRSGRLRRRRARPSLRMHGQGDCDRHTHPTAESMTAVGRRRYGYGFAVFSIGGVVEAACGVWAGPPAAPSEGGDE